MKEVLQELGFDYLPMFSTFHERAIKKHEIWGSDIKNWTLQGYVIAMKAYNQLTRQPLTKGMFVACDEEGKVLDMPESYDKHLEIEGENHSNTGWSKEDLAHGFHKQCQQYQKAQERVLFEEWQYENLSSGANPCVLADGQKIDLFSGGRDYYKTIEHAINNGVKLKLK